MRNINNRYAIEDNGDVYSKCDYHGGSIYEWRKLKPWINKGGYKVVTIDGKKHTVHRLVAFAFIHNFNSSQNHVNHLDGDKLNNNANNLEWCTQAENNLHAYSTGLNKYTPARRNKLRMANLNENSPSAILDKKKVRQIKRMLKSGTKQTELADKYGVSPSTITAIKKGRAWANIEIK